MKWANKNWVIIKKNVLSRGFAILESRVSNQTGQSRDKLKCDVHIVPLSWNKARSKIRNYLQIWQAEKLSTWLLSSGQDFDKKFFDSKHVLKVYFKPSRKKSVFSIFLPLLSKPASMKKDRLNKVHVCCS